MHERWAGQLFSDEAGGEPIATILTTIGQDASASVAAGDEPTVGTQQQRGHGRELVRGAARPTGLNSSIRR